jgi:hypothetical protein
MNTETKSLELYHDWKCQTRTIRLFDVHKLKKVRRVIKVRQDASLSTTAIILAESTSHSLQLDDELQEAV